VVVGGDFSGNLGADERGDESGLAVERVTGCRDAAGSSAVGELLLQAAAITSTTTAGTPRHREPGGR
jgi:hypothetical protein